MLPVPYSMDGKKAKANHGQLKDVHSRCCRLKNDAYALWTRELGWFVWGWGRIFALGISVPRSTSCHRLGLSKLKHICKDRIILEF